MCTMHSAWVGTSAPLSHRSTFANASHAVKRPRVLRVELPSARRARPSTHAAPRAALAPIDEPLGPAHGSRFSISRWGEGIRGDIRRRGPLYLKDWMDGFSPKAIPTILFLYCACLAPVVAFGGVTSALTGGSMGVVEMLLSSGATGMIYAVGSGQPLTFIAPTGLTLAFTAALYGFCQISSLPFLATYAWVGIWTSIILLLLAVSNSSDVIKHCTRFTDDIFNSLIATNFVWTAANSLAAGFFVATVDKTRPFTALALAIGTVIVGRTLSGLRTSRYFVRRVRTFLSDFGPIISVVSMSAIAAIPAVAKIGLPALSIPKTFSLAHGRPLFIPLMATPMHIRLAAIVPALLLTCLFYLDQNISVRVVNAPHRKLRKGPGYHLDMFMLAVCTFLSAICAMPMMCAGTVQSLAHVQALTNVESVDGKDRIVSVVENRLTPFLIHALIFGSLLLLPVVSRIPMAVIAGLFLYLGRNMMAPSQNDFLGRIRYLFMDPKLYPEDSPMKKDNVPARQVNAFTILQLACLSLLWVLKLNKATAMYFPCVIGVLMIIRSKIAPHFFPKETLAALDAEIGKAEEGEPASKQGTASLSTQ